MSKAVYDFTGQTVMVTGANGNLGSALARAYAGAGANLILVGRHRERVAHALPELRDLDSVFVAPGTDLTDQDAVSTMMEAVLVRFGNVDVLANTVGGYQGGKLAHETDVKSWDRMMTLNARSAFVISRAVIPSMLAAERGWIIHTASRAAAGGSRRAVGYGASKSAVVSLVETLALELKRKGINVNCVLPGTIDTPENRESMPKADHSRWVTPEAIAPVFLFLSSEDARPIHGACVPAYGLS